MQEKFVEGRGRAEGETGDSQMHPHPHPPLSDACSGIIPWGTEDGARRTKKESDIANF